MLKPTKLQRLMFLLAVAGLFALTADFACLDDVCADLRTAEFRTMDDIQQNRVLGLQDALSRAGMQLSPSQTQQLKRDGHLFGVMKLDRPVKHPDGSVEMPANWLPAIPEGHPWQKKLTPADDAFYSYFEERIVRAKLFDPQNPEHMKAAEAYLAKAASDKPEFVAWTYAERTECKKPAPTKDMWIRRFDASPDAE